MGGYQVLGLGFKISPALILKAASLIIYETYCKVSYMGSTKK